MATPLDAGLLENFASLFAFLFVFVIVFGILSYVKFMGDNKGVSAIIALILAIISLFSETVVKTVVKMAPWFVLFFIFIVFVLLSFMIFGAKEDDIFSFFKNKNYSFVGAWVLIVVLIIFFGSFFSVLGEERKGEEPINSISDIYGQDTFIGTIFHPKVLGAIIVLLVGMFAIQKLASKSV